MKDKKETKLESAKAKIEFGSMGLVICQLLLNEDLPVLWASMDFYRATGYTEEEYQKRFSSLRHYYQAYPKAFQIFKNTLLHAFDAGETRVRTNCQMPVSNGMAWFQVTATMAEPPQSDSSVINVVFVDVTDMVFLQEQRMHYFELMLDEYVGNIYISDMSTYELLYVNKVSCETLQRPMENIIGKKCYEVIQGRSTPCPFCTNDRLSEDSFYEWEFFNPVLDRTFMIKNRIVNWYGHKARIELSHDMYSAEYKLAKKDREREALLRTIPGGFARLDARDFKTVLWYGADFLDMIGYTKEQFEKELHSQCTYIHPDDHARVKKAIIEPQATGQNTVFEVRIKKRSGEQRILTITMCYVDGLDSWDGIPSFYSIGLDITEEREEQQRQRIALEDAYQAVRVANSAKTDFLSSMSHDIRTPMNAIMGMTAIARANMESPERVGDCLNKINVSSRHLLSLINEVLDMSKIESGKLDLVLEAVDLPELIQGASDMCKALLTEKKHDFKVIVGQVQHEKVITDGDRLQQVFLNLLSNAIKYTPEGGKITLLINERPSIISKKAQYEFVFTDNGIGMEQEFLVKIFEPFSRAEDSRISKIQGTGLGMAITDNIVHMMNGTIDVKSEPGKGSQFIVTVPLELQIEEVQSDDALAGLPVLVVDDDQIVCENAALLLNELGMRGCWVLSGAEAVESVQKAHHQGEDYFAVILDWKMPEIDGLETVRLIRRQMGEEMPIIIISAYDFSDIEEEFLSAGADAFITKPLFKSKMLHVLQLFCYTDKTETEETGEEEFHARLLGKRVLLAEDNDLNREIAVELLKMQEILVETAENGKQAIEMFEASKPGYYQAILMDIQMPVMDGYEATAKIRAMCRADSNLPIFALTANAFVSDMVRAQSVGMNDHVSKPIDIEKLVGILEQWVR
ncbi:response regulator [Eubacterium sp. AM05-23]|uniref:Stage 0 sporulation protein A homolog n=1 Tax=Eubacterium maltosivorans TaxID=2041044 RepID=A0A4P9CFG0_EUBML|nr:MULTISPECIES: response regulator [Eubacterium]MDO5434643.1 response regulator [Eubacterium sp.]QCT73512.1 PAS domain-containing protein [Eubacterium maltosivorans]RHO53703.1 response regulator [Eubacterium sp. AM05-23]